MIIQKNKIKNVELDHSIYNNLCSKTKLVLNHELKRNSCICTYGLNTDDEQTHHIKLYIIHTRDIKVSNLRSSSSLS